MADLKILQHYLCTQIPVQVENPAHGQGLLAGLPFNRLGELVRAQVQFPPDVDDAGQHEDFYLLEHVVPVLYDAAEVEQLLATLPEHHISEAVRIGVANYDTQELHDLAALIDGLRALGVALNMSPNQYIRRWVHRPVMPTDPQPLPAHAGQMSLF